MEKLSTVVQIYHNAAKSNPGKRAFYFSEPDFKSYLTYAQIWNLANSFASDLKKSGLLKGDRIGIWAFSSWRWEVAQLAILICGATVVGIDLNESPDNYSKIEEVVNLKFILFENDFLRKKWCEERASSVRFLKLPERNLALAFESQTEQISTHQESHLIDENKEAFIFFTSGTTSAPKAISYNHRKMIYAIEGLVSLYPEVQNSPRTICWLPLANLFQRMSNFSTVASNGEIFFVENPIEVVSSLAKISPDLFISVPRFYEKIYDTFLSKISKVFFPMNYFIHFGIFLLKLKWRLRNFVLAKFVLQSLTFPWQILIFNKFKRLFGSHIKILISGSAPLKNEIIIFFHAIGLPILEAYGASENIIPIAANRLSDFKLGSVGRPVVAGSVRISGDGEVLVKGHGLFSGYLRYEKADVFEEEFYRTGDLGFFDQDGFLFLLGRKSEVFKTGTGRKVATSDIESMFKKLRFIDQVVVLGEAQKVPFVILTIDFSNLAVFLNKSLEKIFDFKTGSFSKSDISKIIQAIVEVQASGKVSVKPGGAILLVRKLSLEGDEITPNMKVKRGFLEKKFQSQVKQIYQRLDRGEQFPIQFVNSFDQEIQMELLPGLFRRFLKFSLLILKISLIRIPIFLKFQSKTSYNRLIGRFLREGLGGLKGPMHKLGQMLSQMPENIPQEIRDELKELYKDSPPVNSSLIRSIVEKELGKPIPAIFVEWKDSPVATGSVGQVHWARLQSGEEVAVKVLIPQMNKILNSDLRLLSLALPLLKLALNFKSLDQHFLELKELMICELDFEREAKNFKIFKSILRDMKDVVVPSVYDSYCTSKVLVTDFIHGRSFDEFVRSASPDEKNRVAQIIWTSHSFPINLYAIFNADPHPGNYLVLNSSDSSIGTIQVAMVDFGFCKRWDHQFISNWKKQILACCRFDRDGFRKASLELGFRIDTATKFFDQLFDINHQVIYTPWLQDKEFQFSEQWLKFYLQAMLNYQILVPGLEIPKEFLSLSRLYWGKFNLMAMLNAKANFFRLTMPYIEKEVIDIPLELPQELDSYG